MDEPYIPSGGFPHYTDSNFDAKYFEENDDESSHASSETSTIAEDPVSEQEAVDALQALETLFDLLEDDELEEQSQLTELSQPVMEPGRTGSPNQGDGNEISYLDVMESYISKRSRLFPQLLSKGEIGNSHYNGTVVGTQVESDFQHSKDFDLDEPLEKIILFPRPSPSDMVGVQIYISHLRQHFMANSRSAKFMQEHATLLSHLDRLFTPFPSSDGLEQEGHALERARKILVEVGAIMDNVIEKARFTEGHHIRIEQFFLVKDIGKLTSWTNSEQVPPMTSALRLMSQKELYHFAESVKKEFYDPVKKMLGTPGGSHKDMSVYSPEERTAATACAEVCLTFAESNNVLRQGSLASVARDSIPWGSAMQPPVEYRVQLSDERKELTGLRYGVNPRLVPVGILRNTQGVGRRRTPSGTRTVSAAARLKGVVRMPHKCIEAEGRIMAALHTAIPGLPEEDRSSGALVAEASDGDDGDAGFADEQMIHGCYETPPFSGLRKFCHEERCRVYYEITEVFDFIYNLEWMDIINKQVKKHRKKEGWGDVQFIKPDAIPTCLQDLSHGLYPNAVHGRHFATNRDDPTPSQTPRPIEDVGKETSKMCCDAGVFFIFHSVPIKLERNLDL